MALIFEIKVVTQSRKSRLEIDASGVLKCYVKATPEKGKANKEVIDVISKLLGVAKNSVEIVSGETSRKKLLRIKTNLVYDDLLLKLGSGIQKNIFEKK